MTFVVLFEDNPELGPEIRRETLPAHLAFIEENAAVISVAGPLAEPDGTPAGGIWIVDVPSPADVDELVKADPFWPTGLRQSVRILKWTKVFENGARLI